MRASPGPMAFMARATASPQVWAGRTRGQNSPAVRASSSAGNARGLSGAMVMISANRGARSRRASWLS